MRITILGLSITSSWGNGHATNYRGLVRELGRLGHDVVFLERDLQWYAANRDLAGPVLERAHVYSGMGELKDRFTRRVRESDLVVVGSYVPQGIEVARWVHATTSGATAFYDIDTPVTLAKLEQGGCEYVSPELVSRFDLYLSFAGGRTLDLLRDRYGARPRPFYCCVDPEEYWPEEHEVRWDLAYLGTYSRDRQPPLESLFLDPAREWRDGRFAVVGPQYPLSLEWPANVERVQHLSPDRHRQFYRSQRFTMNLTRAGMVRAGHAPGVRLFEAAGCGTPVISDAWEGLDEFFEAGSEILVTRSAEETLDHLARVGDAERREIGARARKRVLSAHTAGHRAVELQEHALEALRARGRQRHAARNGRPRPASAGNGVGLRFVGGRSRLAGAGEERWPWEVDRSREAKRPRGGAAQGLDAERDPVASRLWKEVRELAPWVHNLHLEGGVQTAPEHPLGDFPAGKWRRVGEALPDDLEGWSVLDVGCNAGFYSFELARRGARVLGIDSDEHYLRQARWAASHFGLEDRVSFQRLQVYRLARMDVRFDLVLFLDVFDHLRYPFLGLDLVSRKAKKLLVFQTLTAGDDAVARDTEMPRFDDRCKLSGKGWPSLAFVEEALAGDPTNWWVPNHAAVLAMLRACGLRLTARPGHEIYLCEPDPRVRRVAIDEEEFWAAVGLDDE